MKQLKNLFIQTFNPLQQLLIIGFFARIFSVIFSKGFGWHDDHFLIIEPAQNMVIGRDFGWFQSEFNPDRQAQGHPQLYTGFHYYLFMVLEFFGINNPQSKMYVVRLLHALWSLLIIKYGYLIANRYGGKKAAWYSGIFLALFWFMPFICVRNLAEFVCVPPVLMGIYPLIKEDAKTKDYFVSGAWLGLAISVRFQVAFILMGLAIALLINRTKIKDLFVMFVGFCIIGFAGTGLIDLIIWKKPFAEFWAYIDYNIQNSGNYGYDNPLMYPELILGLLIPPLSFVLLAGFFFSWKKTSFIFWPVLIYLAFHTYFPNKQERFVLSVLPLLVISGTVGMFQLHEIYKSRISPRLFNFSKKFVIVLNLVLLPILSLSYSKRHLVETMYYFYKNNITSDFWVEASYSDSYWPQSPRFYYNKWAYDYGITKQWPIDTALKYYNNMEAGQRPNHLIFMRAENIEARVDTAKKRFPGLRLEAVIEPSLIDKTLHFLNPLNENETNYIYRIR